MKLDGAQLKHIKQIIVALVTHKNTREQIGLDVHAHQLKMNVQKKVMYLSESFLNSGILSKYTSQHITIRFDLLMSLFFSLLR